MANLTSLSDSELISSTERAVLRERESTESVIEHLEETERRRLYAKMGYSSLFTYCTKRLKYCNASAQLRISAMRLAKEVPQIKKALKGGTATLSNVATLQQFIKNEEKNYSREEKAELFQKIEGRSKWETERFLATISPHAIPQERTKVLTATETEVRFVANDELMSLIGEMKKQLHAGAGYAEVFEQALKKALKRPVPRKVRGTSPAEVVGQQLAPAGNGKQGAPIEASKESRDAAEKRHPGAALKRQVRADAGEQCTFVSKLTGHRCTETANLQDEHIIPYAKGGPTIRANLTLHCPAHNRIRAIEEFGEAKMAPYLDGPG